MVPFLVGYGKKMNTKDCIADQPYMISPTTIASFKGGNAKCTFVEKGLYDWLWGTGTVKVFISILLVRENIYNFIQNATKNVYFILYNITFCELCNVDHLVLYKYQNIYIIYIQTSGGVFWCKNCE